MFEVVGTCAPYTSKLPSGTELHAAGDTPPMGHELKNWPEGQLVTAHGWQPERDCWPEATPYLPAGHVVGAPLPAGQ